MTSAVVGAFNRFLLVGGIGFLVDATVLTVLTHFAGWTPWQARAVSFPAAVLVTWGLNRRYTFKGRGPERTSVEALLYFGIQTLGAIINLAVFSACLARFPQLRSVPALALAAGSIAALACNFALSNYALYARRRSLPALKSR